MTFRERKQFIVRSIERIHNEKEKDLLLKAQLEREFDKLVAAARRGSLRYSKKVGGRWIIQ